VDGGEGLLYDADPFLHAASDGLTTMMRWQGCQEDLAAGLDAITCGTTRQKGLELEAKTWLAHEVIGVHRSWHGLCKGLRVWR
jgi:hypothetical protein